MKKCSIIMLALIMTLTLSGVLPSFAYDYSYAKSVELVIGDRNAVVNGRASVMDQAAYVKNGRTLVPFRFLAEALGAKVSWDGKTNTASLSLPGSEVKVTIGSKSASINGKVTQLDVPAEIRAGRTFIPLRFVSEGLGAKVDYDSDTKTITVVLIDTNGWKTFNDPSGSSVLYPNDWTLAGDFSDGLVIASPSGSKLLVKYVPESYEKVLEDIKATYIKEGFEIIDEGQDDPSDPIQGYSIVFGKEDTTDPDESVIAAVSLIEEDAETIVTEISASLKNSTTDVSIIEEIVIQ